MAPQIAIALLDLRGRIIMKVLETSDRQLAFSRARREMIRALGILDQLDAPGEVASHLDLAICRLEQHLE